MQVHRRDHSGNGKREGRTKDCPSCVGGKFFLLLFLLQVCSFSHDSLRCCCCCCCCCCKSIGRRDKRNDTGQTRYRSFDESGKEARWIALGQSCVCKKKSQNDDPKNPGSKEDDPEWIVVVVGGGCGGGGKLLRRGARYRNQAGRHHRIDNNALTTDVALPITIVANAKNVSQMMKRGLPLGTVSPVSGLMMAMVNLVAGFFLVLHTNY